MNPAVTGLWSEPQLSRGSGNPVPLCRVIGEHLEAAGEGLLR
jgi:hypothetical protein